VNDNVKLLAYRIFDTTKAAAKPDAKAGEPTTRTAKKNADLAKIGTV
jgi:hypothetical protein